MPLILAARNDVTAKEKVDRSGLTTVDWVAISVDNHFRQAHFSMADAEERARKLARLDVLLDDPDLAKAHGPHDSDRLDAIMRHAELHFERKRFLAEARGAAKETARYWEKLPSAWQTWFVSGFGLGWSDSGVFPFVANDPMLCRLRFWQEALTIWRTRSGREMPPPPF